MIKQRLILIGYKWGVYVALAVFFITCFIGYISNNSVETIIKKAIISGCALGLVLFVAIRIFANYIPEDIDLTNREENEDTDAAKTSEQPSQQSKENS